MKKIIIVFFLLALSLSSFSCGGGSGSSETPSGENPGTPSITQLLPSHYIAHTNSDITLHARVLDGNGVPVRHVPVRFTNLSPVGVLSATSDKTNDIGIATVILHSHVEGFATIQAEVNKGVAIVRDRKTVYFSMYNTTQLTPTMTLEVSGNGDPYTLFETGVINDNEVNVTATVSNGTFLVSGSVVAFGADRPYKVGTSDTCSDESVTCDVIFPFGNTAITNDNGEASVLVRVVPTSLTSLETILNIYAQSDTGAFSMVTLFLKPVSISNITVYANPLTVDSGGTSKITAFVTTTAGTPAPDGTTVTFTANKGGIDPFSQTTDGLTEEVTFTAPEVTSDTTATITAKVGEKSGTVLVGVTAPVIPPPPDTTSPTVSSTIPANGATGVAHPTTTVTINFSENINCSTVTTTTVTITPSATWTLTSCSGNKVVFNGTTTAANTLYTVNVGTGVKDLAGNVAVASVFSFTTGP